MADIDLYQPMNRLWPTSYENHEEKLRIPPRGKGEFKHMNVNNQDDPSSPVRFTPRKDDSFSSKNSEMGTRPTADPKTTKNFKKILGKKSDDKDKSTQAEPLSVSEEEQEISMEEEEVDQKKQPGSLFELSSNTAVKGFQNKKTHAATVDKAFSSDSKAIDPDDTEDSEKTESPSTMFAKMSMQKNRKADPLTSHHLPSFPIQKDPKEKNLTRFSTEQADLSYVNPVALTTSAIQEVSFKTEKAVLPVSNMQEVINQLVEKIAEMKDDGKTDTVLTLKQPPLFAGANLVVTSFDNAKGEFNLSFENLTQAAKTLLDMQANQHSLKLGLEQKGYAVHIVTTTTLVENRITLATSGEQQREKDREGQNQRDGQRRQQQENEA